jgi:hypothetical protein
MEFQVWLPIHPPLGNFQVALELQTTGIEESFKMKPPDLATLERCLKGPASMCSCQSAQWAMKCHEGTPMCLVPHRHLPSKVVLRWLMACPRLCSLHPLRGGASSVLCFISAAPPDRSGGSGGFPWSTYHKDMEAHSDHNPLSAGDARASTCSFLLSSFAWRWSSLSRWSHLRLLFWSYCHFTLCMGVLVGMCCLLAGHQGSRSGVIPNSHVGVLVVLLSTYLYRRCLLVAPSAASSPLMFL